MRLGLRHFAVVGTIAVAAAVAACSVSGDITVPNLSLSAGASCSNADPDASVDAGGCGANLACVNSYCVGTGALRFSMKFAVDSDFDLHVKTPGGDEIYYSHKTGGGGTLDVDQCVDPCGAGEHVENVVFDNTPASGTYQVWALNYTGRATGTFTIDAVANGQTQTFTGTLPAQDMAMSQVFTYDYPPPAPPPVEAGSDAPTSDGGSDAAPE